MVGSEKSVRAGGPALRERQRELVAVTMIRFGFAMSAVSILLFGCDTFDGPVIGNGFGTGIQVTITYADGTTGRGYWPTCARGFIGKPGSDPLKLVITRGSRFLHELDEDEIREITKKEDAERGYAVWNIGPLGATLITDQKADPCYGRSE